MVTERLSTVTVSPSLSCLKMGVPPDATNKTPSLSPLIFWRKQPKPAQQQVNGEQSKSQPAKMKMIHKKQEANGKKHLDNELLLVGSFPVYLIVARIFLRSFITTESPRPGQARQSEARLRTQQHGTYRHQPLPNETCRYLFARSNARPPGCEYQTTIRELTICDMRVGGLV
jgi:hypothetical protein